MPPLSILVQYIVPQHALSRLFLGLTRVRWSPFRRALTATFLHFFKPNLAEAVQPNPFAFENFNAFFTRALRPDVRPLAPGEATLTSPVDGTVSQLGRVAGAQLLQAKGRYYSLEDLLAGAAPRWAQSFRDGTFATIYLAPHDYHRIHMPADGTLHDAWYVPGRLFCVNNSTAAGVPQLFARNERLILLFRGACGDFAVIFVGALNVGSMATVWHGDVTPRRPRVVSQLPLPTGSARFLARGAEVGRFNMGSTVILLFQPGRATIAPLQSGKVLRMGVALGELILTSTRPPEP
jgi:phosphatidylserine decarboxylase